MSMEKGIKEGKGGGKDRIIEEKVKKNGKNTRERGKGGKEKEHIIKGVREKKEIMENIKRE